MNRTTKRLYFEDGYERMAYFVMQTHTGAKTQIELSQEFNLSFQRVSQIIKAGYARTSTKPTDPAWLVGLRLRQLQQPTPEFGTPEFFFRNEARVPALINY